MAPLCGDVSVSPLYGDVSMAQASSSTLDTLRGGSIYLSLSIAACVPPHAVAHEMRTIEVEYTPSAVAEMDPCPGEAHQR